MTKRERDELRQKEARRRMCLHHFLALCVCFEYAWAYGLDGGGSTDAGTTYLPVNLPPAERKFVIEQWQKIVKWRMKLVEGLNDGRNWERGKQGFYTDANAKLEMIEDKAKEFWPEGTREDFLIIQTYILHAAFHDYAILRDDRRPALRYLAQTLGTLVNRLMPKDSPLVEPMNKVYWATRDAWQEWPDWTRGGELEWGESEQDKYLKEKAV